MRWYKMVSENEEKYGVIVGIVINEVEKGVKDIVNLVK